MYGLTDEDLASAHRAGIRRDADAATRSRPSWPADVPAQGDHRRASAAAIELGLYATNMPASVGGPGCTALQQVLVQEQCGRVTNGLGWVMATPPQWWPEVATPYHLERWLLPTGAR